MLFILLCIVALNIPSGKCAGDIYVTSASCSSVWSNSNTWALEKGYSVQGATPSPSTCFCSKGGSGQWAILNIPHSEVAKVRILSYNSKMQGTYVEICQSNSNCRRCGNPSPVSSGGLWTEFVCESGVKGDQIKVIKDKDYVAFCEVEIFGTEYYVDKGQQIYVTGGYASSSWGSGWVLEKGYTPQGGALSPSSCYCSKNKGSNYASLYISLSYVKEVKLMAYTTSSMQNTVVKVCKDSSCVQCGGPAPKPYANKDWVTFTCFNAVQGNTVRVERSGDYLGFCEVEIWSTGSGGSNGPHGPDNGGSDNDGSDGNDESDDPATIACRNSCTDYHRFCRRLFDSSFDAEYEKFLKSDEAKRLNIAPHRAPDGDCSSSGFYRQFCPNTCNTCNC